MRGSFRAPLMRLGAYSLSHLGFHHEVRDYLRHGSQWIFGARRGIHQLACQLVSVYPVFGHPLLAPFVKARHFHWSQQRLAFVKTLIYTLDFTRPADLGLQVSSLAPQ
jgi:hypothetical protein